jgi:type II secretory pathway component PulJ
MRQGLIHDESGMTLVELLVATAAGVIVMFGVVLAVIVTLRETDRISTHIDANQRARLTMTRVINQLHSACVAPQIAPVREKSNGTTLIFWHQTGSAVAPVPVESKISLSGTTLTQFDYPSNGGTAPNWTFSTTASSTTQLMTGVSPISESIPVFRYFGYTNGQINPTPLTVPLEANAGEVVQVNVAFQTSPMNTPIKDSSAKTGIQGAALLRLTPPSYSSSTANRPCQ